MENAYKVSIYKPYTIILTKSETQLYLQTLLPAPTIRYQSACPPSNASTTQVSASAPSRISPTARRPPPQHHTNIRPRYPSHPFIHILSNPPGGWDRLTDAFPTSLDAEIDQAFANVENTLQQAGGTGLQQVYKLRIYIMGEMDEYFGGLIRHLKAKGIEGYGPLLTVVQVEGLFRYMRIEIEAEAWVG
jgi:enamine deaminase RidA (YjgF/YER057c/UK114 family)